MTAHFILLLVMSAAPQSTGTLLVEATLVDGSEVVGTIDSQSLNLSGITPNGETVRIRVSKPPEWSTSKWVCEIDWDASRQIFVVRNFAWTGELKQIWDRLIVSDEGGKPFHLNGREVAAVRFGYLVNRQESR